MKTWAVFVYCTYTHLLSRWIDSEYAREETAIARAAELDRVMGAFGVPYHKTSVVEMSVSDVALTVPCSRAQAGPVKPDETQDITS